MQVHRQHAQPQAKHSQIIFHFVTSLKEFAKERVVLPHQHFLGDSISLSDSLCRTGENNFYSRRNLCGRQNHTRFSRSDNGGYAGISHGDRDTMAEGTKDVGM
jgi:hypothetical protein